VSMAAARAGSGLRAEPVMPPGFSLVTLREAGDAFRHAQGIASREGAGTLVWTRRFDLIELAVVLEPEEPLKTARLAHYIGMNAFADCLAAIAPPEKPLAFDWPDALLFDGALLGGGRTAIAPGTADGEPPEWLVFGLMARTAALRMLEPGETPNAVSMEDEGFADIEQAEIVEGFARHLMSGVDEWRVKGPKAVCKRFLDRLTRDGKLRRAIAPDGDLWIDGDGPRRILPFAETLATARWLAADGTEPRL
jgi:Biotin/lipoate A/B protein ligase family